MLKTTVKASRITNLTDARYFAAWEVNYIGFDLEVGSEYYIAPELVKAMKEWLEGPQFVAELGSFPDFDVTKSLLEALGMDAIQLGTMASNETIETFAQLGLPIIKEYTWNETSNWPDIRKSFESVQNHVECFLIDFSQNNVDVASMKMDLKALCHSFPILIDAPISGDAIDAFLDEVQPKGLSVKGGEEEKVGYKSFDEVDDIFEALEIYV